MFVTRHPRAPSQTWAISQTIKYKDLNNQCLEDHLGMTSNRGPLLLRRTRCHFAAAAAKHCPSYHPGNKTRRETLETSPYFGGAASTAGCLECFLPGPSLCHLLTPKRRKWQVTFAPTIHHAMDNVLHPAQVPQTLHSCSLQPMLEINWREETVFVFSQISTNTMLQNMVSTNTKNYSFH